MGRAAGSDTHYTWRLVDASGNVLDEEIRMVSPSNVAKLLTNPDAIGGWQHKLAREWCAGKDLSNLDAGQIWVAMKKDQALPTDETKKAQDRGTAAHAVLEDLCHGERPEPINGYQQGVLNMWDDERPIVLDSERKVWSTKLGITGTFDLRCLFARNPAVKATDTVLADLKTRRPGKRSRRLEAHDSDWAQLGGYYRACQARGLQVHKIAVILVGPDGEYDIQFEDPEPWAQTFESLLPVWRQINGEEWEA